LFSAAERAALRVAQGAAQAPNVVTDEDFTALKQYYTDTQVVDIVAVRWETRRSRSIYGVMNLGLFNKRYLAADSADVYSLYRP